MTRREAIAVSIGAMIGTFIRPTPRRTINLMDYCGGEMLRYDCRLPYVFEEWTYATDSFICLRVRPVGSDKTDHKGEIPPIEKLTFNHDTLRGWKTLPKLNPIIATDTYCQECNGYGRIGYQINWKECRDCQGYGHQMEYDGSSDLLIEKKCKSCHGNGFPIAEKCPKCNGKPIATMPGIVCLEGHYFDYNNYEKIRKLNVEFICETLNDPKPIPMLKFKFSEGDGMMIGLDKNIAEKRISDAK